MCAERLQERGRPDPARAGSVARRELGHLSLPLTSHGPAEACDHGLIQRFIVTIEGPGWEDVQDVEMPRLPGEGEAIETRYGTCIVTKVEKPQTAEKYDGKIFCRLP
ncbi:MAG TPA: hypothetical protein VFT86_07340 [Gaiellaceae bacterium]|nr:hypothetical protein [Gaiellaceae bacterium]